VADLLRSLLAGFRAALRREQLPEASPAGPQGAAGPGLLQRLFAPEVLGVDPEPPPSTRPEVLATIFRPETLGTDPAPPPRRHVNWIAFLAKPERLDD
jgi:hypothetical protein